MEIGHDEFDVLIHLEIPIEDLQSYMNNGNSRLQAGAESRDHTHHGPPVLIDDIHFRAAVRMETANDSDEKESAIQPLTAG